MRRALLLVLVLGCGGTHTTPVTPPVATGPTPDAADAEPETDPVPPELRLPTTVKPTAYDAELTLDPSREDFTGQIAIDLAIAEPTTVVWLNQEELEISDAAFTVGGRTIAARPVSPIKDYVAIVPASPLPAGPARLTMRYAGKMHRDDGTGIYPVQEGGQWYAFTQFESRDAREAFPCFDEPSFKVPWKLAIHTRQELAVVANMPVAEERAEAGGTKVVRFVQTKPLPSYLIAFAVGPFDFVDAGKTAGGAPIRIVVPKGRGGDARYPVEATRPLVDLLERYFGMPYPFPKLDLVAVPVFNAGAMENPGLITYRQGILLVKPAEITRGRRETFASVTAHELAHMWFGDYVTLAWWDDTWLNESFASWMASKIIEQYQPDWEEPVSRVDNRSGVMSSDSLDTARAIRQPITRNDDIENAFDGITYGKGEAVLHMIERHVGADVFQRAVRAYLTAHAWGNATYDDFVSAMSTAAGKDLKPLFDSFVLQSGVPVVTFELACKRGAPPALQLAQRRYAPTGSKIDRKRTWTVPICVRWGAGAATGRDCTVLTTETATLPLSAKTCPAWVMPNDGAIGYYRMQPKGKLLDTLLARAPKALTLPERVGLLGDVNALVGAGELENGKALTLVGALARDPNPHIVDASVELVAGIDEMVPDKLRPNYARLVNKLYRARALQLGWQSRPGDDDNTKRLRRTLLGMVATVGHDRKLIAHAKELAWKWLDDHHAVEPELVGIVLGIAVHDGDAKLFDRLYADAKKATDRGERQRLLGALGGFTDPALVARAMQLALTDEFELREAMGLIQGAFSERKNRATAYKFVVDHVDQISAKLPEPYRPYLAFTFVALCDDSRKPELEAFWKPRIEKLDGGPRIMAQALEAVSLCAAARKAQTPGVVAFLRRQ